MYCLFIIYVLFIYYLLFIYDLFIYYLFFILFIYLLLFIYLVINIYYLFIIIYYLVIIYLLLLLFINYYYYLLFIYLFRCVLSGCHSPFGATVFCTSKVDMSVWNNSPKVCQKSCKSYQSIGAGCFKDVTNKTKWSLFWATLYDICVNITLKHTRYISRLISHFIVIVVC